MLRIKANKKNILWSLLLIIPFFISNYYVFRQNGLLWDDWVNFNQSFETLYSIYFFQGGHFYGLTHFFSFLNSISDTVLVFRVLNLSIFTITGYYFYKTLQEQGMDSRSCFLICLIFLLLPFDSIRSFYNVLVYNLCLMLFTIGVYHYLNQKTIKALILIFISFITNSFLFFFPVVFMIINGKKSFARVHHLLIIPVFYSYKKYVAYSRGQYADINYNNITYEGLKNGILEFRFFFTNLFESYKPYFLTKIENENLFFFFFLFLFIFCLVWIVKVANRYSYKYLLAGIGASLLLIFAGYFPYAAVKKYPIQLFYESRHQLLLNFGFSLLIFFLFRLIYQKSRIIATIIISAVLTLFIFLNYNFQKDIYINSKTQIDYFSYFENKYNDDSSVLIVMKPITSYANTMYNWRIYEYGAYLNKKKKKLNKIIIPNKVLSRTQIEKYKKYGYLFISDFDVNNFKADTVEITIPETNKLSNNG